MQIATQPSLTQFLLGFCWQHVLKHGALVQHKEDDVHHVPTRDAPPRVRLNHEAATHYQWLALSFQSAKLTKQRHELRLCKNLILPIKHRTVAGLGIAKLI